MLTVQIPDELAERLREIAECENKPVDEVVVSMLQKDISIQAPVDQQPVDEKPNALDALMGMLDYDITDMSSTVKETLREYYRNKYTRPD
jgi:hypothetical protein